MTARDLEGMFFVVAGGAGALATFVYLTVFDGPHPQSFLGWCWEVITNAGMAMFWPIYWPLRLLFGF
ncbi:hypothetical protein [Mameliella alba]|uniref:hypothetical protein n=1 Tax=Mameliella alba TaxID=561184 RepID=UPI000B52DCA6|nr:hypothetical protein [Mameliella alba]OWV39414.1 hypothetical protein CDZ95_26160 [Mameliella alba]